MCFHSHADHDRQGKSEPLNNGGQHEHPSFWKSKSAMVMMVFSAIAGFFLVTEHWAHLYGILPFLFILVCPLMHIFMHHGHGGHHHHKGQQEDGSQPKSTPDQGAQS